MENFFAVPVKILQRMIRHYFRTDKSSKEWTKDKLDIFMTNLVIFNQKIINIRTVDLASTVETFQMTRLNILHFMSTSYAFCHDSLIAMDTLSIYSYL